MKKFLIVGCSTYYINNFGDDAMLVTLIQGLRKKYTKCSITILARYPNKKLDKIYKIKSVKNFEHDSKPLKPNTLLFGFNEHDDLSHFRTIKNEISKCDMLILGGNLFMEIHKNRFLIGLSSYSSLMTILSKFFNKPTALYGVNVVKPITSELTLDHAKFVIQNAKKITIREKTAQNFLKDCDVNSKKTKILGDPALGVEFKQNKFKAIRQLEKLKIKIPKNKKLVGVCIREEYWKINKNKQDQNLKKIAKILDNFQEKSGCNFLFIPNCTFSHDNHIKDRKWQDDRYTHLNIDKYMKKKQHNFLINDEIDFFENLNLFTLLDMHITNRRHSLAFAALNGVSSVVIGDRSGEMQNHQNSMADELGLNNNKIKLNKSLNFLNKKMLNLWMNKSKYEKIINKKKKKLIKLAKSQVNFITKDI